MRSRLHLFAAVFRFAIVFLALAALFAASIRLAFRALFALLIVFVFHVANAPSKK